MKKIISIALALTLLITVFAGASAQEPVTLSLLYPWAGALQSTDDLIAPEKDSYDARWPEVLEALDVRLEYVATDFSTAAEQIRMMSAAGTLPDIAYCCDQMNPRELVSYAENGMIFALDPEKLAQYPNIQRNLDSITALEAYRTSDGKYAALPRSMDINGISGDYTYMLVYRKDMAQAAGCEIKDAYTIEELYDFYMKVKEAYPDVLLASHLTPAQAYQWGIFQYCPYFSSTPAQNFYYNEEKGRYVYAPAEEGMLEGILWMKKFYDAGIFSPDYINMANYESRTLLVGGTLFSEWDGANATFLDSLDRSFRQNNPEVENGGIDALVLKDKNGRCMNLDNGNKNSEFIFSPDISEEKLDAALRMFDYLMSDEGIERAYYGLEGVNFERAQDGTLVPLYDEEGKMKSVSSALICQSLVGEVSIALDSPYVGKEAKERVAHLFEMRMEDDPFVREYDIALNGYSSPTLERFTVDASNQVHKMIMTLSAEEIPAAWEAWLAENAAAIEHAEADLNENLKR